MICWTSLINMFLMVFFGLGKVVLNPQMNEELLGRALFVQVNCRFMLYF